MPDVESKRDTGLRVRGGRRRRRRRRRRRKGEREREREFYCSKDK